jgi:diguanylate cyclase (GGDEF)-like protein
MSGDEFTVLLESVNRVDAIAKAKSIATALAAPYPIGTQRVVSRANIGVAVSEPGLSTTDDYLRAADAAMYLAKTRGLGRCAFDSKARIEI